MRRLVLATIVLVLVGTATLAAGDTLRPGTRLQALTLNDQHDERGGIDASTALVLLTRDMAAAKVAKEALAENGELLLENAGVIYVTDVARMPGFVTRFFAIPAMRKRPYRMLLDRDGKATADLPTEEGQVTLIYLDELTIRRVEHLDSAWAVRRALRAAAAARAATRSPTPVTSPDAPAAASETPATADQPDS